MSKEELAKHLFPLVASMLDRALSEYELDRARERENARIVQDFAILYMREVEEKTMGAYYQGVKDGAKGKRHR